MKDYHVSGSLPPQAKSYVLRKADEYLDKALTGGQLCYVFNAPQTGKSSLKVAVNHKLRQKGFICGNLDLKKITQQNISQKEWYLAIITSLATSLGIKNNLEVRSWWQQQD
ncbi:MAG: diguanylate cyclase, partial [Cyanobacteria bacterium J083]